MILWLATKDENGVERRYAVHGYGAQEVGHPWCSEPVI